MQPDRRPDPRLQLQLWQTRLARHRLDLVDQRSHQSSNDKAERQLFPSGSYNTPAWRALVACQEIGHDFGLDHQDETFNNVNLGTCMDYTNAPDGGVVGGFNYGPGNRHPNAHDYDELKTIYNHNDGFSSTTASTNFGIREVGKATPPSLSSAGSAIARPNGAVRFTRIARAARCVPQGFGCWQ